MYLLKRQMGMSTWLMNVYFNVLCKTDDLQVPGISFTEEKLVYMTEVERSAPEAVW